MRRSQSSFGRAAIGLAMAVVVGCEGPAGGAVRDAQGVAVDSSAELVAVAAQMAAFNRHDVAALAAGVSPDFVWLSVAGEEVSVEARGREGLEQGMGAYFTDFPDVSATIEEAATAGSFVAIRERLRWSSEAGERSQSALAVYEVRAGLIQRVWYYPTER